MVAKVTKRYLSKTVLKEVIWFRKRSISITLIVTGRLLSEDLVSANTKEETSAHVL